LDDVEAEFRAEAPHPFGCVFGRPTAKRSVGPENHKAHSDEFVECPCKVLGRNFGHVGCESERDYPIGSSRAHQFDTVFERSEIARRDLGPQYRDRMWMERYDTRGERASTGLFAQSREQRLVTTVHPVKHTDGER
jgi:hypothetical protein